MVGGLPAIVLSARRVMREGRHTLVATSTDRDDDLIEDCCQRAGIPVFRGPRDDVLARFHAATADLGPDDLCVRLTGDNLLPDHNFVSEVLAIQEALGCAYVAYGSEPHGNLPYGLSAEVFTIAALRQAQEVADAGPEREHVTPLIAARHGLASLPPFPGGKAAYSGLRCTIDTYDDYERVARLFLGSADSVRESWTSLCDALLRASERAA